MSNKKFLLKYGSSDHLDKLATDINYIVRRRVAMNPNATKEHLDKLVNGGDEYVSREAKNQLNKRFPQ